MTPQKTKLEIIEELFDNHYVKDPSKRATSGGGCYYYDSDTGNKCAVGMCMLDDATAIDMEQNYSGEVHGLEWYLNDRRNQYLDDVLKEEYRGHDIDFWVLVQTLHDSNNCWTDDGLSDVGIAELKKLKESFA